MSSYHRKYLKIVILIIFILIIAFTLKIIVNTPSQAQPYDNITVDIGEDGFLVAQLDECLKINEYNIDDGFALNENTERIQWYDAKNISFVDSLGNKGYMLIWKTPIQNYNIPIKNGYTDYGKLINNFKKSYYFITYNQATNSIYGIILNKPGHSINNLVSDVLGLNMPTKDETTYNTSRNYTTTSYRSPSYDVDTSPETIAKNDPDWYYDYYDYGDYPEIDDYLESEGYEGDYPNDYPDNYY